MIEPENYEPEPRTPEEQARWDALQREVDELFARLDCSNAQERLNAARDVLFAGGIVPSPKGVEVVLQAGERIEPLEENDADSEAAD